MDALTAATARASGLRTRQARWVFIFAWLCLVWLGFIDVYFTPFDYLNASAYAAGLAGGLLLTTPGTLPLARWRATLLPLAALYLVLVALYRAPAVADVGALIFAAYLVAFAIPRGNVLAGGVGSALVIGYATAWGVARDATGLQLVLLIGIPIGSLAAGVVWRLVLGWIVRQEHRYHSTAVRAAEDAAASLDAVFASRRELAAIRAQVLPLLEGIVDGRPVDADTRIALVRVEASIRDSIRAPHLQHPALVEAFAALRDREVTVVVLGESTSPDESVDEALIERIIDVISPVDEGRITVRSLPPGRRAAVSIVIRGSQGTTHTLLSATGATID